MKIFVSYARLDGVQVAQSLSQLLDSQHELWVDIDQLSSGHRWTSEIETAIDTSDIFVAVITRGSGESPVCRSELERALRKQRRVLPLLVHPNADIPLPLESIQWSSSIEAVVAAIEGKRSAIGTYRPKRGGLSAALFASFVLLVFGVIGYRVFRFLDEVSSMPPDPNALAGKDRVVNDRDRQIYVRVTPKEALGRKPACSGSTRGTVAVSPFWIGHSPFSQTAQRHFARRSLSGWFSAAGWSRSSQNPAEGFSPADAEAACRWAGLRLPTESELATFWAMGLADPGDGGLEYASTTAAQRSAANPGSTYALCLRGCITASVRPTEQRSEVAFRCAGTSFGFGAVVD
ncbi:MAG: TIR domain-containing protein [Acidobacteria bacterium]|nr:TIR domain-containing protein [Acidobacteriota bacterium]